MTIILTWIRTNLSWNLISSLFFDKCSFTFWLSLCNCSFRIILSRSWIAIGNPYVFTTNRHLFFIMSKILQVTIILSRIWTIFTWNLISSFFSNQSSLTSRLGLCDCSFWVILSWCRVSVISMFVFSSDSHFFRTFSKRLEMSIILAWVRSQLSWDLISCLFFY